MNKEEKIRNLKVLLQECLSNLGFSLGQERDPDELWVNNVESLTAGIRALQAQGAAEPERPKSREAKLLDALCEAVCNSQKQYDRDIAASLIQAWREGRVLTDPLVAALLAPKLAWAECEQYGLENKLYAAMLKMMVPDVCPGVNPPAPDEEDCDDQV